MGKVEVGGRDVQPVAQSHRRTVREVRKTTGHPLQSRANNRAVEVKMGTNGGVCRSPKHEKGGNIGDRATPEPVGKSGRVQMDLGLKSQKRTRLTRNEETARRPEGPASIRRLDMKGPMLGEKHG